MIRRYLSPVGSLILRTMSAVGRVVWTLLRPGIRFIGAILLVAGIIALAVDVTRWQTGGKGPLFASLDQQIRAAAPATLDGIGKAVSNALHPWLWDPVLTSLLALPAWFCLLAIALLLAQVTRERRQVDIFIN